MNSENKFKLLREKAEKLLNERDGVKKENHFLDINKLIKELSIQQSKLELQNEELQEANQKLVIGQNTNKELNKDVYTTNYTLNQTSSIIGDDSPEKLINREICMHNLFHENGVPMLIIDPKTGLIEDANNAASGFYGYTSETLKSMNIYEINQLSDDEIKAEMMSTRKSGKKYFNFKHRLANGEIHDVEVYSNTLNYDETTKLFSIILDTSERKKAIEKNIKLNTELSTTIEELNSANEELNTINEALNRANNQISAERRQFLSILDSIPETIYVSDMETNQILFANKKLKELIGRDITGEVCYEAIQCKNHVCDFCTNKYIKDNTKPWFWEYFNPVMQKHFFIMNRKINWTEPKEVRFELAVDVTEQKLFEQKLKENANKIKDKNIEIELSNERLESLLRVSQFQTNSKQELLDFTLAEAIKLTGSKIGYIYNYDEEKRQFVLNSWSRNVMKDCDVIDQQTVYDLDKTGIWGEAVRQRKAIVINDFQAENPLKKGTPQGHIELKKFLTIPIIFDNKIVAVIGVANKEKDYVDADIRQLTLLMDSVWKISERLFLIEDLKITKEQNSIAFDNANMGIMNVDIKGKILYANNECSNIFGFSTTELTNITVNDITVPEDKNVSPHYIQSALNDNRNEKAIFEKKYFHKNGTIITCEISSTLLHNTNGDPLFFISHIKDITKEKQAEERLRKSEEKYRLITENASDVIWILNLTTQKYTYISPSIYGLRGFTAEEAMQQDIHESLTPESAKTVMDGISETMPRFIANPDIESKKIHRHDLRQTCKDGSVIWIETTTRYQFNADKEVEVIGISRNIDERKQQQQRIENHLRYEKNIALFSNTLLLELENAVDKSFKYIQKAANCSRVYMFENFIDEQNQLCTKQIHKACAPGVNPDFLNPELQHIIYDKHDFTRWKEEFTKGEVINETITNIPKKERAFLDQLNIKSILAIPIYIHQKWVGFIGFDDIFKERIWKSEDIDLLRTTSEVLGLYFENQKNKNTILQQNEKLTKALATKDRFISILGHDLKNPFHSILGFSELLLLNIQEYENDKIHKFVSLISDSAKQTYNLLNNLLEWSLSQSNKIPFNPKPTNLYSLVQETHVLLKNSAGAKNIQIQLHLPEQLVINVDSEKIKTVFRNLIGNAIKFTPENGKIAISAYKNDNSIKIEIADTGTGMDEETKNSLFKIGKNKSTKGTHGEKGTGFGLLLCNEFIEKHKGTISVESKLGKGSRFIVTLPLNSNRI